MVALSDIRFLAKDAAGRLKGIAGSTITVALATLARGLSKTGDIDIDAIGPSTTTVQIRNSTPGQVSNLNVSGNVESSGNVAGTGVFSYNSDVVLRSNGSTHSITLTGNPTGNRVITFPDSDYTIGSGGSGLPYIGSYTNAALHALPAPTSPVSAYCSDLGGVAGGGVVGVFVYWSMA